MIILSERVTLDGAFVVVADTSLAELDPFQTLPPIRLSFIRGHIEHGWEGPAGDAWIASGGTKD